MRLGAQRVLGAGCHGVDSRADGAAGARALRRRHDDANPGRHQPAHGPASPSPAARANAPPEAAAGPFPLIVFAHGSSAAPADFAALLGSWAAAGYVVAAPEFPLTGTHAPANSQFTDYINQPRDISFVIDQMLGAPPPSLAGLVDARRVGVAGHSIGGATTMALAFNSCCLDPRVKAVVVMAGVALPFSGGTYFGRVASPPALFLQGSADQRVVPATGISLYNQARPPKNPVVPKLGDSPAARPRSTSSLGCRSASWTATSGGCETGSPGCDKPSPPPTAWPHCASQASERCRAHAVGAR